MVLIPPAPSDTSVWLAPIPRGWKADYRVLGDGRLSALIVDPDIEAECISVHRQMRSLDQPPPELVSWLVELKSIDSMQILLATETGWEESLVLKHQFACRIVDRFSDGRWLIDGRGYEGRDYQILSPRGEILRRVAFGRMAEHVSIDAKERVWIAWSDEGIYADEGRRDPGADNGIACFSLDGSIQSLPELPPDCGTFSDCYALNVVGSGAWVYPYTDFPLINFVPGHATRWWYSEIGGAKAIAVDDGFALLAGGYRAQADRLALLELGKDGRGETASLLATWSMPLRLSPPPTRYYDPVWNQPVLLSGRGDTIHLIENNFWYRWRVRDLVATVKSGK